ncbi:hypothetical protein NIES806_10020 [Dolichospermum compactum NIES-806]|uniref:Transposase n=1 Tax=Dolichospermum compactum NIES-806 TaxID=1973481 RepID=A0A1Z4V0C1_9CYAN|nr:hypothetical protein NIES806_10020 [Dolichospermum compactum NIES-806]
MGRGLALLNPYKSGVFVILQKSISQPYKHRQRIPNYSTYQKLGIPIGSGSVESKIKQIGARVKISGAIWKRQNVPRILRVRCAYLNNSSCLSIYSLKLKYL